MKLTRKIMDAVRQETDLGLLHRWGGKVLHVWKNSEQYPLCGVQVLPIDRPFSVGNNVCRDCLAAGGLMK